MTTTMAAAIEDIAHRHQMGLFDIDVKNLAKELEAAGFGLVADAGAKALEDAAGAALDRTVGMDSHIAREADDRGYMQRHNVRAASNWLRARAAAVRGEG